MLKKLGSLQNDEIHYEIFKYTYYPLLLSTYLLPLFSLLQGLFFLHTPLP